MSFFLNFLIPVRGGHCYASPGIRKSSYATEDIHSHYMEEWHLTTMVYNHVVLLEKIFRDLTQREKTERKE